MCIPCQEEREVQPGILSNELLRHAALAMEIHVPASAAGISTIRTSGALRQAVQKHCTYHLVRMIRRQSLAYRHTQVVRNNDEALPPELPSELDSIRGHRFIDVTVGI